MGEKQYRCPKCNEVATEVGSYTEVITADLGPGRPVLKRPGKTTNKVSPCGCVLTDEELEAEIASFVGDPPAPEDTR